MSMYAKYIYPKIIVGKSHARPEMPYCFIRLVESSVTWDIFSVNDADRAEFWEVDMAKDHSNLVLMTLAQVETEVYGVEGKAAWIAAHPMPEIT